MKKIIPFFLLLFSVSAQSAVTHKIREVRLKHDPSKGTFVSNSVTYGNIVGIAYDIIIRDTVTGVECCFTGLESIRSPLGSFPTRNQLANRIKSDAISKGLSAFGTSCLNEQNAELQKVDSTAEKNISGIENFAVTIP